MLVCAEATSLLVLACLAAAAPAPGPQQVPPALERVGAPTVLVGDTPETEKHTVTIDLVEGEIHGEHPAVTVIAPPRDSDRDGWLEAVVRLDLHGYRWVEVEAEYGDAVPSGMTLNLGDSRTNNGFAGDSATQSNDAEAQVHGRELTVWGNDHTEGERKLASFADVIEAGGTLSWRGPRGANQVRSAFLYALNGQDDEEGQVDYHLWLGLNRSVASAHRRGAGLARVTLRFAAH
jgi:hypothetical protein